MREATGNLWTLPADARCITTNGSTNRSGLAVMGRGVAAQAKTKYPDLPRLLGQRIRRGGNHVADFYLPHGAFIAFPVKHHWDELADPDLIARSCDELMALVETTDWERVLLPRPGCGFGRLLWSGVKPLIAPLLDDRITVVSLSESG